MPLRLPQMLIGGRGVDGPQIKERPVVLQYLPAKLVEVRVACDAPKVGSPDGAVFAQQSLNFFRIGRISDHLCVEDVRFQVLGLTVSVLLELVRCPPVEALRRAYEARDGGILGLDA